MHSTSATMNSGGGLCLSEAMPWMVLESARGGNSCSRRRQQAVKSCVWGGVGSVRLGTHTGIEIVLPYSCVVTHPP